jgi:site-specific DNA recombinase
MVVSKPSTCMTPMTITTMRIRQEACEAYVKSQGHEGWRLLLEHYVDGGLSGASLDRRALQLRGP